MLERHKDELCMHKAYIPFIPQLQRIALVLKHTGHIDPRYVLIICNLHFRFIFLYSLDQKVDFVICPHSVYKQIVRTDLWPYGWAGPLLTVLYALLLIHNQAMSANYSVGRTAHDLPYLCPSHTMLFHQAKTKPCAQVITSWKTVSQSQTSTYAMSFASLSASHWPW